MQPKRVRVPASHKFSNRDGSAPARATYRSTRSARASCVLQVAMRPALGDDRHADATADHATHRTEAPELDTQQHRRSESLGLLLYEALQRTAVMHADEMFERLGKCDALAS